MHRRRLNHPHLTAAGTAVTVVEAFYDDAGTEVHEPADAARYARAFYAPDGRWLSDDVGPIGQYAVLDDAPPSDPAHWRGPLVFEGIATGDGRLIEPDALAWDDGGLTLYAIAQEGLGLDGHAGQQVVGRIDRVWRDGGTIMGEGRFDLASTVGRETARQIADGFAGGISADLDDVSVSIRVAADLIAQYEDPDPSLPTPDADGRVEIASFNSDDELMVTTDARIRAATLVGLPAFADARIELTDAGRDALSTSTPAAVVAAAVGDVAVGDAVTTPAGDGVITAVDDVDDDGGQQVTVLLDAEDDDDWTGDVADVDLLDTDDDDPVDDDAFVASLAAPTVPDVPPADWFADPGLSGPTPLTVDEDGRIYGHLATWGSCHTGFDACVTAPRSDAGYAHFHVGSVVVDRDGTEDVLPAGRITLGTGHANLKDNARAAARHYDNSGTAIADVRASEGAHGIWVAGSLRPGVAPERVRELRSSPLSGDWRRIGRGLGLVAALAVNTPGFNIPHPEARVASGAPVALVASSGVVARVPDVDADRLDADTVRTLRRIADRQRRADAVALRDRVYGGRHGLAAALLSRVHGDG